MIAFLAIAHAGDIVVDSEIEQVTVYRDRARVMRQAKVKVPAGRSDLVFEGLPIQLQPQSLSAEGEGRAALLGIDVRPKRGTQDRDAKVAALETEKLGYVDARAVQQDIVARVKGELGFLNALKPVAPKKLDQATFLADDAPAQLGALASNLGADMRELLVEQRTAEIEIRRLSREIGRVDRELQQLRSPGAGEDSQRVAVGVNASQAGTVTVRIFYLVTGASWKPHYDARYDLAGGEVQLDLSGTVVQTTGEDWTDVELVVSTARPQQSTAPPKLEPFFLQEGYGTAGGGVVAERTTAVEYPSASTEDIPRDGTARRVYLKTLDLKGEVIHKVVARRMESAWLTVRAKNPADWPLLGGEMSSYLGSAYVGDGMLPLTAPGAEVDLSFGVDDRVGVKRIKLEDVEADSKALGNKERAKYGFKTTVKNRTGGKTRLVVIEQVPASRQAAYEVKSETTPEVEIPTSGVFLWETDLADGKEQEFVLRYEVIWPQGDRPVLLD